VYDGTNRIREIFSSADSLMKVEEIAGEVYFLCQQKIYKSNNGSFVLWKDFSGDNYYGWLKGRSEIDFFGMGRHNEIVHYNGTNMVTVFPNTLDIFNMFVVGDSIFILCLDLEHNINTIVHGKLK
jgi:hypothetical protein